ncbi:hypothetical protein LCGC14_1737100 [marine sediment metagenome]|uniref:Uncharacterized protein n=1 Tax=marine sediment metagenome TaxID=412755 RepID=A0A0F9H7T5_9ZZZZ
MGRLTETWATDKPGTQSDYAYITPKDKKAPGAVIVEDYTATSRTPEQIEDYCNKIEDMHLTSHVDGELLFEGVQIIRQLQSELAGVQSQEDRDYATATPVNAFIPIKINIPTIESQEDEMPRLVEND